MAKEAGLRVVLIDNDVAVLELLALDMRLEGHRVVATATTGEEGLRACTQREPDVLVQRLENDLPIETWQMSSSPYEADELIG